MIREGKVYFPPRRAHTLFRFHVCFWLCLCALTLKSGPVKTQVCVQCVAIGNTYTEVVQRSGFNRSAKMPTVPSLISAGIMLSHWLTLKDITVFLRNNRNQYLTLTKGNMQCFLLKFVVETCKPTSGSLGSFWGFHPSPKIQVHIKSLLKKNKIYLGEGSARDPGGSGRRLL